MTAVPQLRSLFHAVAKEQQAGDVVDRLNYLYSAAAFTFVAIAISAKQLFEQPIQCWNPAEFDCE